MARLSFGCTVNHLESNIAEVIVDSGIELSIEMVEELDNYLSDFYSGDFALLVNKKTLIATLMKPSSVSPHWNIKEP